MPSKICTYQVLSARVDDKQAGCNIRQSRPEKLPRHEYLDATPSRQDVQQEAHGSGGEARERGAREDDMEEETAKKSRGRREDAYDLMATSRTVVRWSDDKFV